MRITALLLLAAALTAAEPIAPAEADATALKALMAQATEAFSHQDVAAMEQVLAPRFVVVMADQHLAMDRKGLEAGIESWCKGPEAPFASVTFEPTADRHAELIAPGVAVAAGTSKDSYRFKSGKNDGNVVEVASRWTATMVKTEAGWRIAQLHLGIDPLDNPMMREAATAVIRWSAIAAGTGLALGALAAGLVLRRRRGSGT